MNHRIILSAAGAMLFLLAFCANCFGFTGGRGTEADPYQISTPNDWKELTNSYLMNWKLCFVLVNDIDFAGAGLKPVGTYSAPFTGIFDGNGYILRNASINMPETDYVGLFGMMTSPGQIKNVGIDNIIVTGRDYVGGLCGGNGKYWPGGGTILHCYSSSDIHGLHYVGGLCGDNSLNGIIRDSFATGTIFGGDDCLGGLCGYNGGGIINSYATGDVIGREKSFYLGGLCGINYGPISGCYATGMVNGGEQSLGLGGLCGAHDTNWISNCYATGPVISGNESNGIGGLCGVNYEDGHIQYCYVTGRINGSAWSVHVGALCGRNEGRIGYSFWNMETCGLWSSEGGGAQTTLEMQTLDTYSAVNWDFDSVWQMPMKDYPHLLWEQVYPKYSGGSGSIWDPYQIATAFDWKTLSESRRDWTQYLILVDDIDLDGVELTPVGIYTSDEWETTSIPFTGCVDGRGHVLRNVTIRLSGNTFTGLFGFIGEGGQVKNLGVEDALITGQTSVGGLCGYNSYGLIKSCYATGHIYGGDSSNDVGGLCGTNVGTIDSCCANGTVVGGNSTHALGGLCGNNLRWISKSKATSSVSCGDDSFSLGGLCGINAVSGEIKNCYASGNVSGGNRSFWVGGLCGFNSCEYWYGDRGVIGRCYSTGKVIVGDESIDFGGLCGFNAARQNEVGPVITECFWDIQTSGLSTSDGGTGKSTAEMKTAVPYLLAWWDFVNTWQMPMNGYPHLMWEYFEPKYSGGTGREQDPYQIGNVADWQTLIVSCADWEKYFVLIQDIDFGRGAPDTDRTRYRSKQR